MLGAKNDYFHSLPSISGDFTTSLDEQKSVSAKTKGKLGELKVSGDHFAILFLIAQYSDEGAKKDLQNAKLYLKRSNKEGYLLDGVILGTFASKKSDPNPFYVLNFNTPKGFIEVPNNYGLVVEIDSPIAVDPGDIQLTFKGYRMNTLLKS